jgi:formiminotetrahydrofolate cyclodeaminase
VTMVTTLALGKEHQVAVQEQMAELHAEAEALRDDLAELVVLDACAYEAVLEAITLFGEDPNDKRERGRVLQTVLKEAAEVPLEVAQAAVDVARLSRMAVEKVSPRARSDAAVAVILADAAAHSAALKAKVRLNCIEDQGFKREAYAKIEAVLSETACLRGEVLAMTSSRILEATGPVV